VVRGGGVVEATEPEGESSPNKIFDLLLIFVSRVSLIPAPGTGTGLASGIAGVPGQAGREFPQWFTLV
jgi:hypothetical protein